MIRLGALMLATLAGLFLVLSMWGSEDLRAERRPVPPIPSTAQDPGATVAVPSAEQAIPVVVQAQAQTPQQVQRFPGPTLRPSPEYRDQTPAPAPAAGDGPVLYVTGDRVNVRAGPSTNDRVVTALGRGAPVAVLGPTDGEWINIRDANGRVGYIAGRFLSATAP